MMWLAIVWVGLVACLVWALELRLRHQARFQAASDHCDFWNMECMRLLLAICEANAAGEEAKADRLFEQWEVAVKRYAMATEELGEIYEARPRVRLRRGIL